MKLTYTKMRHKFNAKKVEFDGIRFDSTLEGDYYLHLVKLKAAGHILQFLRQVPFHLPGNVRYVVDFMEMWANGALVFSDVKGIETPEFKIKRKLVEDLYRPITINIVKRGDIDSSRVKK